ncbi:Aspartate 1-decarboxylase [Candidatus Syntrophocurvum alkaliphilum]|uniref:Aspartate 1-decarboxylase n=1 Tax=Candidatus Syntrophocurvum alkaliphilum TaxID=2293317 RepID=A0A6I6DKI5_9FIRM|nr:aspartate 1-decarboxylase [Candidatus Syntrophocurvum alkaliphilum]QGU00507.1 Aspartate 1-decarboxylase [Candidatus Syntrophocurvum alkaliphilum]
MMRYMLKSKIHRAVVTEADLNYVGSITIGKDLLEASDIIPNEKVTIVNNNNGERFETYVIEGERGSKSICLNGAAARLVQAGDVIIILTYTMMNDEEAKEYQPKLVFVNEKNEIQKICLGKYE